MAVLLTGCGGIAAPGPSTTPSVAADGTLAVTLKVQATLGTDGTLAVSASTNLPDGTELGAAVRAAGLYQGGEDQTVAAGAASFGPFSAKGGPLPAGTYDVSVTMPIARNQPASVRSVIGDHGERLTGPGVSKESITGDAVVEATTTVVIP